MVMLLKLYTLQEGPDVGLKLHAQQEVSNREKSESTNKQKTNATIVAAEFQPLWGRSVFAPATAGSGFPTPVSCGHSYVQYHHSLHAFI